MCEGTAQTLPRCLVLDPALRQSMCPSCYKELAVECIGTALYLCERQLGIGFGA